MCHQPQPWPPRLSSSVLPLSWLLQAGLFCLFLAFVQDFALIFFQNFQMFGSLTGAIFVLCILLDCPVFRKSRCFQSKGRSLWRLSLVHQESVRWMFWGHLHCVHQGASWSVGFTAQWAWEHLESSREKCRYPRGTSVIPVPFSFTEPHPCHLSVESCTNFTLIKLSEIVFFTWR